jgi:hypothetical protein
MQLCVLQRPTHLSSTEVLRLGRDLTGTFPQMLEQIDNARLREMLARIDVTPDSLKQSGAKDWANFTDRMHFIADFFRLYQEQRHLFDAPFMTQQVTLLSPAYDPMDVCNITNR